MLDVGGVIRKLRVLEANMEAALQSAAADAARDAAKLASSLAPVGDGEDGGHLRDSIFAEDMGGGVWRAAAANPHAAYVEFGTGRRGEDSPSPPKWDGAGGYGGQPGMAARPYLYPAAMLTRDAFFAGARESARAAIAAAKGGDG